MHPTWRPILFLLITTAASHARAQPERTLPLRSPIWQAYAQEISPVGCEGKTCRGRRLVLANQPIGYCHRDVVPSVRYVARGGREFWGVDLTLFLRPDNDRRQLVYRVPATVRLISDQVQDVCVPAMLPAGRASYAVELPTEVPPVADLSMIPLGTITVEPSTQKAGVLLTDATRSPEGGGFFTLIGQGVIDFLFGRSRNSLIRVRLESQPAGSAVFLGPRQIATTTTEFMVAPKALVELAIRFGQERRSVRECRQEAGRETRAGNRLLRIVCTFGGGRKPS